MQSPWVFFTPAMPGTHAVAHQHGGGKMGTPGLIPLNVGPNVGVGAGQMLGGQPGNIFGAFPTTAQAHHHHHHSQLLLAAAAAAAYGQQCAAAATLLQPRQHIPNGNFHLKVDDSSIVATKRKSASDDPENIVSRDIKKAKLETKALKAKRPGFTDERYNETSYYVENALRKVYPYYFTFTTFTKGRWVGEKILDVFAREFRAHPVEEYERCIKSGTLTVNYTKVETDYRLKHNDLLANIVHRHEVPVTSDPIEIIHMDEDLVVVNKPASIPVHPCGRYRHNTVVFILAKEHQLKNLRTIHRLDRLTSGLLLFGRSPKKAREMEQQIRNRMVSKQYVCRVEGEFPDEEIECRESIEVVSYKIGVCKVSKDGKECRTTFKRLSYNGKTSVVIAKPHTGRMHQIRVHLQYLGYPIVNDPLYNHPVFGPEKGKGGLMGKSDDQLIAELISIHNAENWLGIEGDDSGLPSADIFGPSRPAQSNDNPTSDTSPGAPDVEEEECLANGASLDGLTVETSQITGNLGLEAEVESPTSTTSPKSIPAIVKTEVAIEKAAEEVSPAPTGKVTVGTQTCDEENEVHASSSVCSSISEKSVGNGDLTFRNDLMTHDPHCYECKVRYRDPKPKDLVMYLHAMGYKGPGWSYETKMPAWASDDWVESPEFET